MADLWAGILALDGLGPLVVAVLAAGLVRGFAGFGSALIIMPMASSVLEPVPAIVLLTMTELFGPLPNLGAAWREGDRRDAARLCLGAVFGLPVGVSFLARVPSEVFGWAVSGIVLALLPLVMSGWRYRGELTPRLVTATGAAGGLLAGAVGLPGPPVIMLYMASKLSISVIRANFLLYLLSIDLLMIVVISLAGLFEMRAVVLGLALAVPYMLANRAGAALFAPEWERAYRGVAYVVIAASAVLGLPLFH